MVYLLSNSIDPSRSNENKSCHCRLPSGPACLLMNLRMSRICVKEIARFSANTITVLSVPNSSKFRSFGCINIGATPVVFGMGNFSNTVYPSSSSVPASLLMSVSSSPNESSVSEQYFSASFNCDGQRKRMALRN